MIAQWEIGAMAPKRSKMPKPAAAQPTSFLQQMREWGKKPTAKKEPSEVPGGGRAVSYEGDATH